MTFKQINFMGRLIDKAHNGTPFTEKEEKFINEYIYGDKGNVSQRQKTLFNHLLEAQAFNGLLDAEV